MIEVKRTGDLTQVVLNRPEKANALTREMLVDLADVAEGAQDAKAFVLTGEGRVFSAGADLDAARAGLAVDPVWERLSGAIAALPGFTIAALNGSLAGGAFGMALACDMRITVPSAKFFYPVMKLGFLPQPSDPKRLATLIGPARAKMVLMGGAKLTAEQALDFGLVDQLVEPDQMEATIQTLTSNALSAQADHIAGIKALF